MTIRTPDPAAPFFDVADPAFSVSSAEVRRAREAGWYARTSYGLAVLRYDQVSRLIRHPALRQGSRLWPAHHGITSGPFADWWASWVLNLEGEAHQRMRRLLSPAFSRRIVEALRPRFGELAGELADSFAGAGRCEFMADFAEPYAARVIAIMLGIAEDEWPAIAAESATLGLAMGVRIREHLPRIEAALAALYDYADTVIAARRREPLSPRDDLVTCLLKSQSQGDEGGLTEAELRDALVLLIFGGFDTTRNQLGLAMQVFLEHPGQWRLLGERPGLGAAAVEEVMRIRPTTTWVTREALDDFVFDGLDIEAGTTIHLFCESAGTDGGQAGGGEFDITATGRPPHFGFGGGIHYCLGHYVARADMATALTVLAGRLEEPRPAGEAAWLPDSGNTGPVRLPIAFTRRPPDGRFHRDEQDQPRGLFGMELPRGQAPGPLPDPAPPPGHVEQEPEAHHDRQEQQDPDAGHGRQDHDRDDHAQRGGQHVDPHPAHVAHDRPVFLGRDLARVPATMAGGAFPAHIVRNVSDPPAVTANGDQGTAHAGIVALRGGPGQIPAGPESRRPPGGSAR
jgi:cytochrome P450